jgi:hypothetical protein
MAAVSNENLSANNLNPIINALAEEINKHAE